MQVHPSPIPYLLTCDELRLSVEFSLGPGMHGRIGSGAEMEISLPLVGIAEEECRINMDGGGQLWLRRGSAEEPPMRLDPPAYLRVGPHRFVIQEKLAAPPPLPAAAATQKPQERPSWQGALSERKTQIMAAAAGVALLLGAAWLATRAGGKSNRTTTAPTPPPQRQQQPAIAVLPEPPLPERSPPRLEMLPRLPDPEPITAAEPAIKPSPAAGADNSGTPERMNLEALAAKVAPCVYLVQVFDSTGDLTGTGTAFCISPEGMLVTNHHVIDGGRSISLVDHQGGKLQSVRILSDDPANDLALLKVERSGMAHLTLAEDSDVAAGKRVAVYGSPEGLAGALSEGIISAPARNLGSLFPGQRLPNGGVLLQTTAPVSPGSSGSPLFDGNGKVLGVMTLILKGSGHAQNLNFAVPVETLARLVELARNGTPVMAAPDPMAEDVGMPSTTDDSAALDDPVLRMALEECMEKKDWLGGLKIAQKLVADYPRSPYGHFKQGYCATMLRLDSQAETSFRRVLQLIPDDHAAWLNLGVVLRNQDKYKESQQALEKAVALMPDSTKAWKGMVLTCVLLEDWAKSGVALQTLARLDQEVAGEMASFLSTLGIRDTRFRKIVEEITGEQPARSTTHTVASYQVRGLVPGDRLSVRTGPGSNYPKMDEITEGMVVRHSGEVEMNGDTEWLRISYGRHSGWVAARFLLPVP